jgi:tetratricopeptide (TPR) repeat protein
MDALLASVRRGEARVRLRTVSLAVGVAVAALAGGAWRLAGAHTTLCAVPSDRLASVWAPGNESSPRRQAVHRALTARHGARAETAWRAIAKALDDYTSQWSAMHVEACEATHVRKEQSPDVLDLRMNCLRENLDGVRALTDVLSRADDQMALSQAVSAAQDVPPLNRCADLVALRAVVPPPRDAKIARKVDELRRSVRDATALEAVGSIRAALGAARQVLPEAEATSYKPLIAEVHFLMGVTQLDAPADAQPLLELALYAAEASRDDVTAAKAALALGYIAGYRLGRYQESERWQNLAEAIIERLSPPQPRLRGWLLHDRAATLQRKRDFASARPLLEQALALKEAELGKDHPDVARTTAAMVWNLTERGDFEEALRMADRSVEILGRLDPDSIQLAYARSNRADVLVKLGRYQEADASYAAVLRSFRAQGRSANPETAYPLHGLGEARAGEGDLLGAIHYFEEALELRLTDSTDPVALADTQFALARALSAAGRDRERARKLATSARETYASHDEPSRQDAIDVWFNEHGRSGKPSGERRTR